MVTVIKSLFSASVRGGRLGGFLGDAAGAIRRMDLGRMAMALTLARFEPGEGGGGVMTVASAGMPPVLVVRRDRVEEIEIAGTPLGTLAQRYDERVVKLESGDVVVMMSDGLPELLGADGEPFGYERVQERISGLRGRSPEQTIQSLAGMVNEWRGGEAPNDDVTFVVFRVS